MSHEAWETAPLHEATAEAMEVVRRAHATRKARRMSLRTLAQLTGLHHTTLSRVERGEAAPDALTVACLRAWLGDPVRATGATPTVLTTIRDDIAELRQRVTKLEAAAR